MVLKQKQDPLFDVYNQNFRRTVKKIEIFPKSEVISINKEDSKYDFKHYLRMGMPLKLKQGLHFDIYKHNFV